MLRNSIKGKFVSFSCRFLSLCLILGGTALCAAGCSEPEEDEDTFVVIDRNEEESPYTLTKATVSDVVLDVELWFNFKQTQTENVMFPVSGKKVEEVYVKPGDRVKKGQLLAILEGGGREADVRELEYQIARSQLQLSYVDINENFAISERWWRFVYQSSGSDAEEERLQSDLESLKQTYRYQREDIQDKIDMDAARLENYRKELEQGRLYAGMDGVIFRIAGNMDELVTDEKTTAFIIIDDSTCLFEGTKIEYAEYFSDNTVYDVTVGNSSSAVVYQVIPWKKQEWEDTIYLELLDNSVMGNLKVGDRGRVTLQLDKRENVLTVPNSAVHIASERAYVYVLGENDIREVKWVETGLKGNKLTEIVSGLEEGEAVILK